LNDDDPTEFILVKRREHDGYLTPYYLEGGEWLHSNAASIGGTEIERDKFYDYLVGQGVETVSPKWREFRIGDKGFRAR
jgi:hypothetical protein